MTARHRPARAPRHRQGWVLAMAAAGLLTAACGSSTPARTHMTAALPARSQQAPSSAPASPADPANSAAPLSPAAPASLAARLPLASARPR